MKPVLTAFLTICLFTWLLPLGTFIKPSQEKTACGGKRAFHMCSMMQGKADPNPSSKISFSSASDSGQGAKSSAGGGDDFLPARNGTVRPNPAAVFPETLISTRYSCFRTTLEPPPKALPLF